MQSVSAIVHVCYCDNKRLTGIDIQKCVSFAGHLRYEQTLANSGLMGLS